VPLAFKQTFSSIIVILPLLRLWVYNTSLMILINKSTLFHFCKHNFHCSAWQLIESFIDTTVKQVCSYKVSAPNPSRQISKEIKRPNKVKTSLWEVKHVTITTPGQFVTGEMNLEEEDKWSNQKGL
jgi:hypothetical protein